MKTFQRVLCVMLSILMALSCLSVAAFAAEDSSFTSTYRKVSEISDKESTKLVLDGIDEFLATLDDGKGIYFPLVEGVIDIDLRDVNGLCKTLDLLRRFLVSDSILDWATTELIKKALGQLGEDINLENWQTGMKRPADDVAILSGLIGFAGYNGKVVSGVAKGNYDMGLINNFVDVDELLGPGGISKMLKEALIGFIYDKDSAEFATAYATYENDIDSFIYTKLLPSFTKDMLPGLTVTEGSTIDSLLIDIYNICLEKYIKPELMELDMDLSGADIPEVKALAPYLNLKGSTYNYDALIYSHDATLKSQINTVIGAYIKNIMPEYTGWVAGGYEKFNANVDNAIKYLAGASGVVADAESKSIEDICFEIARIILKNGDFGAYEEGLENCTSLEDMTAAYLINVAKDMKLGVSYTGKESYLVVAGDIFAAWAYDNYTLKDTNGKDYRPGGGKDIFEVANYLLNYFLFDRSAAAAIGLQSTKSDSFFTKLDKIVDYFGENKAVNFNSKTFLLGDGSKKGLLDSLSTLDIGRLLELTIVPILDNAGPVLAEKFIYNTVYYFLKNWAGGKDMLPAYQTKAFTNALSSNGIGNMIEALLSTLAERKSAIASLIAYVAALLGENEAVTYPVEVTMTNLVATGKTLTPKATVKANGKTLTQNKDYIIIADKPSAPGTYTATIKGIGLYNGEIEKAYTVSMDKVSTLSYSNATTTSVKLTWGKVPYATSYTVSKYDTAKKKYVTVKAGITSTSYTVTGLAAGSENKLRVQAVSTAYGSTAAKDITAYTVPSAVSSKKISTSATASSVKLSWTAVTGATQYKIEYKAASDKKWKTATTTTKTSYTVSGLSGYTSYSFRITALKKLPDGSYLTASATTVSAKTLLGTPSSLKASATSSTMTLTWSKVNGAEKYEIRQYTKGKWKTIATTKKTSYKISKLKSGTSYKFSVRAVVGKKTYGSAKELSAYTLLPTPTKLKVNSTTATSAKLSWAKVSGASSYDVYAYIGKKWKKVGSTKKTSITIKKLSSGTKIKFKVKAVAKKTSSAYSSEVTALTLVSKVSSLKVAERKTTSIKMKWSKVTGATSYEIYRYNGKKWKKIGTTKSTSYTDSKSLKKGTQYQYKVRAVQKVSKKTTRYGDYSSVLKAKTTVIGTARF